LSLSSKDTPSTSKQGKVEAAEAALGACVALGVLLDDEAGAAEVEKGLELVIVEPFVADAAASRRERRGGGDEGGSRQSICVARFEGEVRAEGGRLDDVIVEAEVVIVVEVQLEVRDEVVKLAVEDGVDNDVVAACRAVERGAGRARRRGRAVACEWGWDSLDALAER